MYGDSWKSNPESYFNAAFEAYYLEQRLLDSPDEWKALMHAFRQPLPTTFRITAGLSSAVLLQNAMQNEWVPFLSNVRLSDIKAADASLHRGQAAAAAAAVAVAEAAATENGQAGAEPDAGIEQPVPTKDADQAAAEEEEDDDDDDDGKAVPPPSIIPFYRPVGLGWQLDVKKNVIRKHPALKAFQQWLVHETDTGCISRQEAVSMVPPLFLDLRSDHIVLDMCAAPGSKTSQLVEMLHTRGPSISNPLPHGQYDANPEGLVLANDSDNRRAHMLVHQASRIPSANLMVSNLDASMLPRLDVPWLPPSADPLTTKPLSRELKYDRILADVPCSGDGTLRKNIPIWKDWHTQNGLGLHALQLRILLRGLALLREGGRLVYSTCSLNPLENEAVVAAALIEHGALQQDGGDIHLVDVHDEIPELTRRPGKRFWKVAPGRGKHLYGAAAAAAATTTTSTETSSEAPPAQPGAPDAVSQQESSSTDAPTVNPVPVDYVEYEHFINSIFNGGDPQKVKVDAVREDGVKLTCAKSDMKGDALNSTWLPNYPYLDSWDQLRERDAGLAARTPKTLWPPTDEAADKLHLERCMRFYPHLQNTGGFFVAVLEKTAPKDGYLHGEQGLAAGMRRAVERSDMLSLAEKRAKSAAQGGVPSGTDADAAARAGTKRELSPDDEPASAKRAKTDDADVPDAEADPNAHLKVDNHAADRAAKAGKLAVGSADFGHGQPNGMPYREDPMTFLDEDDPEVQSCIEYFKLNIDDASARANQTLRFEPRNLLSRNAQGKMVRSVNLVSYSVRAIVSGGGRPGLVPGKDADGNVELDGNGEPVMVPSPHPSLNPVRLRLLSAGLKFFQRQEASKAVQAEMNTPACKWRVTSDGVMVLLPYLPADKIVKVSMNELAFLMSTSYPSLYDVEEHAPALAPKVRRMALGSHIIQVGGPNAVDEPDVPDAAVAVPSQAGSKAEGAEDGPASRGAETERTRSQLKNDALLRVRQEWKGRKLPVEIAIPMWKSVASVNLMIDKQVKSALSHRLFGRDLSSATGERHFNAAPPPKKKNRKDGGKAGASSEFKTDQDMADDEDAAMAAAAEGS